MYGSTYRRKRKGYNLFCEWLYCNEGGVGGASRQTVESASRKDFMTDIIHHFSVGRCYFLVGRG